jgi:hypothetical protein
MKSILVALLLVATVLAGCSGGGSKSDDCTDRCPIPPPAKGKGVIVGLVVDGGFSPVKGAKVIVTSTELSDVSDDAGRFMFQDVNPGLYQLTVSKPGYGTVNPTVDVIADDTAPEVTKVLLMRIPGTEPYVEPLVFEGFIECSAGAALDAGNYAFYSACSHSALQDVLNDRFAVTYELEGAVPTFAQSEMVWTSSQALGNALAVMYSRGGGTVAPVDYVSARGTSPLVIKANQTVLETNEIVSENPLWIRAFPWAETVVGVTLQQKFTVYTHLFYNFEPAEDWTFGTKGEPVPPA